MERRLFIGVPTYNGSMRSEAFDGLRRPSFSAEKWTVQFQHGSLLAYVFNMLLVAAVNSREEFGWNIFGMAHNDISFEPGAFDVLMDERERCGADILSVVVPIKDGRGVTSTGIVQPDGSIRRLTLTEAFNLPETFDGRDACREMGLPETCRLAVNTGLWVCDLDKIVPLIPKGLWFSIADSVKELPNGKLKVGVWPEDWNFSRLCHEFGLKVMATRKVPVFHYGEGRYPSCEPWGTWTTDEGDEPKEEKTPLATGLDLPLAEAALT
jgi:hypothetical protein